MAYVPPIVNPTLPYVGPIPGGRLTDGQMIVIQGKVPHHQHSFSINLSCIASVDNLSETAFHFNPRFNERCVVRNNCRSGQWGQEERNGHFPFSKGQPFEVIILVHPHHYKVSVNGKHFCDFRHRMPKESVQYLMVGSGLEVSYIKFEGGMGPSPPPAPGGFPAGGFPSGGYPSGGNPPIYNPPVPFQTPIPGVCSPGRMIFISGIPHSGASRFTVNLNVGQYEGGDIAMHFDVRFNYGDSHNIVVRTHRAGGSWGTEDRYQTYFPFMPNANFDMIILVEPVCFKIAVNNNHYVEFPHRIVPVERVGCVSVNGDVRLTQVRFQ